VFKVILLARHDFGEQQRLQAKTGTKQRTVFCSEQRAAFSWLFQQRAADCCMLEIGERFRSL
jgi:hypothetical protein